MEALSKGWAVYFMVVGIALIAVSAMWMVDFPLFIVFVASGLFSLGGTCMFVVGFSAFDRLSNGELVRRLKAGMQLALAGSVAIFNGEVAIYENRDRRRHPNNQPEKKLS